VDKVDPRQIANAFSPSVQWSDIVEGDSDKEFTLKTPLMSSVFISQLDAFSKVNEDNDTKIHPKPDVVPSLASDTVLELVGSLLNVELPSPLEKRHTKKSKKIGEQSRKRSKSSKAFRKFMAHLSFQPSNRELAQLRRDDAVAISDNLPSLDLKLPEFRVSPTPFNTLVEEDGGDTMGVRQLHATMCSHVTSPNRKGRKRFQSSPALPPVG